MLTVRSAESVWLLYVLTALQLGASSFFFTARTAILPDIVEPRALGTANGVLLGINEGTEDSDGISLGSNEGSSDGTCDGI